MDGVLSTLIKNRSGTEIRLVYHELLAWYMPITLHDMKVLLNRNIIDTDSKTRFSFLRHRTEIALRSRTGSQETDGIGNGGACSCNV